MATGLTKIKIEKELAGHETKLGIDLLSKLDLQKDVFAGNWTMDGHNLKALPANVTFDKVDFPTPADMNHYQLIVELIQRAPAGLNILIPVGKRAVSVQINPSRGKDGLTTINGANSSESRNPTSGPGSLVPNQRFTLSIDVLVKEDQAEIQVENSKRRIISWKGPIEQLDVDPFFAAPHRGRIAIIAFADMTIFYTVRLIYSKPTPPGSAANR